MSQSHFECVTSMIPVLQCRTFYWLYDDRGNGILFNGSSWYKHLENFFVFPYLLPCFLSTTLYIWFILHVCAYLNCEIVYRQYLTVTRQQVSTKSQREKKTSNEWAPENWKNETMKLWALTDTNTHHTGAHELWTPVALRQETINICA